MPRGSGHAFAHLVPVIPVVVGGLEPGQGVAIYAPEAATPSG
jgi:hypothetical protein